MNVLSLFGGIEVGRQAMKELDIKVEKYYSSEVDKHVMYIANKNHPDVIQVGDITKLKGEDFKDIDLIIGGSPCQGFSTAGKQLNFNDERSKLILDYIRLLKEIKPKYFMLENVRMNKNIEKVVSEMLGVEPIHINSSLVSAQNRPRVYWTNIPNITIPEDRGIKFNEIISKDREWFDLLPWCLKEWGGKRKVDTLKTLWDEKSSCLTTSKTHSKNYYLNQERNKMTKLNADEAEILQTLPAGYTRGIPEGHRFKAIGNGWTKDVIVHILSFIPKE